MKKETTKTVAKTVTASLFSRKIGNTTFVVSVSCSDKAAESIEDKILRLVTSDINQGEVQQCG